MGGVGLVLRRSSHLVSPGRAVPSRCGVCCEIIPKKLF